MMYSSDWSLIEWLLEIKGILLEFKEPEQAAIPLMATEVTTLRGDFIHEVKDLFPKDGWIGGRDLPIGCTSPVDLAVILIGDIDPMFFDPLGNSDNNITLDKGSLADLCIDILRGKAVIIEHFQ
jgi:hypothetical protein